MSYRFYWLIFFALVLACDTASNVSPPNKNYFIKYFGQDGDQIARDLIVNDDGTFYILGNSRISVDSIQKVYLAHVNAFGEVIKQITYGSAEMDARDFILTSDGKIAIAANQGVGSLNVDILLTIFTLDLAPVVNAVLFSGTSNTASDNANSLTELGDGGFIVEGFVGDIDQSDELHLRVDSQLKKYTGSPWTDTFGPDQYDDDGIKIFQYSSKELYIFGNTNAIYSGTNKNKFWTFSIGNSAGPIKNGDLDVFEKSGTGQDNKLTDAVIVPSGGYLTVGISSSATEDNLKAAITIGTDTAFNCKQSGVAHDVILKDNSTTPASLLGKNLNPTGQFQSFATVYSSINNHNFILANKYNTPTGKSDILLTKVDNNLVNLWGSATEPNYVSFGGDGDDAAAAVAELPDGHIMVLGTMQLGNPPAQFKITLMKLNSSGKLAD